MAKQKKPIEVVLQEIFEVKAVPPNNHRSELIDLLIIGKDEEGNRMHIRIKNYPSTGSGYNHFQKYYEER